MPSTLNAAPIALAELIFQPPGSDRIMRALREGDNLVVGSDASADVQLAVHGVARTHCMIHVEDGRVFVRDCYSSTGTLVDDIPISRARIDHDAMIRVGDTVMRLRILSAERRETAPEPSVVRKPVTARPVADAPAARREPPPSIIAPSPNDLPSTAAVSPQPPVADAGRVDRQELEAARHELVAIRAENDVLRDRLRILEKNAVAPHPSEPDPFQEEMIELLKSEVQDLQSALAEALAGAPREIGATGGQVESALAHGGLTSSAELDSLEERLEQLLAELQERDEQVMMLNDLLQSAEDATRAEQDERRQLQSWVSDIEQRFSQREGEWQAERDRLIEQCAAAESERGRLESALAAGSDGIREATLQKIVEDLRKQVADLNTELDGARAAGTALQKELESARQSTTREEEVRLAMERAELSRLRFEIESQKRELEKQPPAGARQRSRVERTADPSSKSRDSSLGNRVARLWGLIDGR